MRKKKKDYVGFGYMLFGSIITLGTINLMMYFMDGITPKEFFGNVLRDEVFN